MLYSDRLTVAGPKLASFSFPEDTALFVVGDAHGQNQALRDLLAGMGRITTPGLKRHLVFLGDLIDRGPDSLGCLKTALGDGPALARADETTYLPGNHELLLADTIEDALTGGDAALGHRSAGECWAMNGGAMFLAEVFDHLGTKAPSGAAARVAAFAEALPHPGHASFLDMVRSWPSHVRVGDVLCVHAGITPKKPHGYTLDLDQRSHFDTDHYRHWAWLRDAFLGWQGGWPASGAKDDDHGCLVLHGHTVPAGARGSKLTDGAAVDSVFNRMATNGRVCLDGGAAREVGCAGAVVTSAGMRVLFQHCEDLSLEDAA
jgi:serine/threonine protein phosphatase 1